MGKRLRTYIKEPSIFFVTTTFTDWKNLLNNDELMDEAEMLLFSVMSAKASAMFGYVLMPSHVHLLIACKLGGLQLSECIRSYKSLMARKIFPTIKSVWMRRFDDLVIVTEKQFYTKLNYIHDNPVRKDLVKETVDWKWSSARFWMNDEPHPVLTKKWNRLSRGDT